MSASAKTEADTDDIAMTDSIDAVKDSAAEKENKPKKAKKDKKKKKKKKSKKNKKKLPAGYKRIQKELQGLLLNPPVGVSACPKAADDILEWIATIDGPENTPYHGGKFYLNIKFPEKYPFTAPKVTFKTKIYHCNVNSANGEICLDVLKDNYSAALTVEKILLSLCALLQEPNPDDPLVAEIANVWRVDQKCHDETAREWTRRYAMVSE